MHDLTHGAAPVGRVLNPSRRRWIVVAWAVVVAVLAVALNRSADPPLLMGTRTDGVASSIDVLDHGGPPLVVSDVPYHPGIGVEHLYPAGITDDQGIYLYLPVLGHWTGEKDPAVLMKWLFNACFALLLLLTPLMIYALFGSLLAAAVAPLLLLWKFDTTNADLYWVQAWVVLLGIPALLLAHRWWAQGRRRTVIASLVPLLVAAGFATSIRSHAGLPVVLTALGIVLLTGAPLRGRARGDWLLRVGAAAVLVVAYASVSLLFVGVRAYRDSKVHIVSTPASASTSHPFWHPAYLGLGYLPNKYGIAWNDLVAIDAVNRVDPNAQYLSASYEHILRTLYFRIVKHDPVFALRTYVTKARFVLADALRQFWLLGILLAVALALRRTRGVRTAFWIALPAFLITLASPLMAIPLYGYELGWLGAVGAAWLLAVSWALTWCEAIATRAQVRADAERDARRAVTRRRTLAIATVVVAATTLAAAARPSVQTSDKAYESASPFVDATAVQGTTAIAWRFAGKLPKGWHLVSGAQLQRDYSEIDRRLGLHVTTTPAVDSDQLRARTQTLRPGRYQVVGHGRILVGGINMYADDASGAPLTDAKFWYGEGDYLHNAIGMSFTLSRPTSVAITLANWTTVSAASSWVLWDLRVVRLGASPKSPDEAFYRQAASQLTPASTLTGHEAAAWSFARTVPAQWSTVGNPTLTPSAAGTDVITTTQALAYQLVSPPTQLKPGRYAAVIDGRITSGGIELGVLDDAKNAWITTQHFYDGQRAAHGQAYAATVTLTAPTRVRVILSNWVQGSRSSEWQVTRVRLVKLG